VDTVKAVQLIETTLTREGDGKSSDSPIRIITQYWLPNGELKIERDPCAVQFTPELRAKMREALYQKIGEQPKAMDIWKAMLDVLS